MFETVQRLAGRADNDDRGRRPIRLCDIGIASGKRGRVDPKKVDFLQATQCGYAG